MDNVYSIKTVMDEGTLHYYIEFADVTGIRHIVEVSEAVFLVIQDSIRKEWAIDRQERRHIDTQQTGDLNEGRLHLYSLLDVEEQVLINERLAQIEAVLQEHTEIQRRRFHLYMIGYNLKEIAVLEGVSTVSVKASIDKVWKKIKKLSK